MNEPLTFESALQELKTITDSLEKNTQDLDASIRQFERGMALIQFLRTRLKEASLKVDTIVNQEQESNEKSH